ncbi:hypothetical protein [Mycolicibacterium iranicum]|uniref:Scaffolding protein n=1 Tax=Mycolicibacterium iranicum TaxID=912594 RepID=A0ABT4HBH2_MYCIR|nr:hypothetical protein [Mycolicibacterium iranicum]MCZ0727196.1 hypothetical protein [Mycolicibacterium iranicum]
MTTPNNDTTSAPATDTTAISEAVNSDGDNPEIGIADTAEQNDTPTDADAEHESSNGEAAKRRRQLREAQTELATVRDQLTTYQRRHAEQVIADVLANPADLFDIGQADLADYLDDNGDIRTDELRAAAGTLIEQRPQLGANYIPPMPDNYDFGTGARSESAPGGASWSAVLSDQRRRQ